MTLFTWIGFGRVLRTGLLGKARTLFHGFGPKGEYPSRKEVRPSGCGNFDKLVDDLRLAKAQRAMFETQAEQAFGRYKELKNAEFAACERIARAKMALDSAVEGAA
jgi:hypothetical protein